MTASESPVQEPNGGMTLGADRGVGRVGRQRERGERLVDARAGAGLVLREGGELPRRPRREPRAGGRVSVKAGYSLCPSLLPVGGSPDSRVWIQL